MAVLKRYMVETRSTLSPSPRAAVLRSRVQADHNTHLDIAHLEILRMLICGRRRLRGDEKRIPTISSSVLLLGMLNNMAYSSETPGACIVRNTQLNTATSELRC